jgi:hypothetical protein
VWHDVVVPLLLTRAALLLIGWISQWLPRNPDFHHRLALGRGWVLTPWRLLDWWRSQPGASSTGSAERQPRG